MKEVRKDGKIGAKHGGLKEQYGMKASYQLFPSPDLPL